MSRRCAEPIEVQRRDDLPRQFLWRGRLYVVRDVLAHWVEAGRWWRTAGAAALTTGAASGPAVLDDGEREYWRVEASAGRLAGAGVYDICLDWSAGGWTVARVLD